jgi:hypothetical protein
MCPAGVKEPGGEYRERQQGGEEYGEIRQMSEGRLRHSLKKTPIGALI